MRRSIPGGRFRAGPHRKGRPLWVPTYEELNGPLPSDPHPEAEEGIKRLRLRETQNFTASPRARKVSHG